MLFWRCFVVHIRHRKRILVWKWFKDRLTSPGASTQWAGRVRDAGQILSSVIGGERGTSEPMMCCSTVAGIQTCGALLASQIRKKQNKTKYSTDWWGWKRWRCECERRERSDEESSVWSVVNRKELWPLFITSLAAGHNTASFISVLHCNIYLC